MSIKGEKIFSGSAFKMANSAAVGGISFVLPILHQMEVTERIAPKKKEA